MGGDFYIFFFDAVSSLLMQNTNPHFSKNIPPIFQIRVHWIVKGKETPSER